MSFNARKRSIWPGACFDEEVHALGDRAWRLFVSLPMMADREGRLEDRPARVKAQIFPFHDDVTTRSVGQMLDALARIGKLTRYTVDGDRYIALHGWDTYQSPHHREAQSCIPKPDLMHEPCTDHASLMDGPSKSQPCPTTPTPSPTPLATPTPHDARENDLASLLKRLEKTWPTTRCRKADRPRRDSALFDKRDEIPFDVVDRAVAYIAAHGFTDDTIKGCPTLHRWIAEARWLEPLPKSKTAPSTAEVRGFSVEAA